MPQRPHFFVADDDELDASLTVRAIRQFDPSANIHVVHNGAEAVAALAAMHPLPHVALLDYKMPCKGCLDILKDLSASDLSDRVPLVLFSSSVCPTDVDVCLSLGIREFVEKPTDPEAYESAVRDICGRYASASSPA